MPLSCNKQDYHGGFTWLNKIQGREKGSKELIAEETEEEWILPQELVGQSITNAPHGPEILTPRPGHKSQCYLDVHAWFVCVCVSVCVSVTVVIALP